MNIPKGLSEGTTEVPLRFTVPDQLTEIDLQEDPENRVDRTLQNLTRNLPGISFKDRIATVYAQERALSKLTAEGAVFVAQCVARSEANPSRLCVAQFSILVKEAALHGPRPLATIASGLRTPGEPREIVFVEFSSGEGLVVGEELAVQPRATVTGHYSRRSHLIRQAQIILPFPDMRRLAILGVTSESLEDWHHLTRILNNIAHSVSFKTKNKNSISSRLNALN